MPGKATTRETIRKNTISALKSIGIYKPEYEPMIGVYAELFEQYLKLQRLICEQDYQTRTPLAISFETVRRDLLNYSSQLGLTPSGLKKITGNQAPKGKISALEGTLLKFG